MDRHVKILGWLYLVLGALGLLLVLLMGSFAAMDLSLSHDVGFAPWLEAVIAGVLLGVFVLPAIAVGWGLLQRKPWARLVGIALGVLHTVNLPLGTILGGYTLWVLLNDRTVELLRRPVAY